MVPYGDINGLKREGTTTAEFSPMIKQYLSIKEQNKDALLFFRLGDFYELFFEDAHTASRELDLVLTGKDCGQAERAPMCGIPYHASETYIAKLIAKGYKVAVCEQTEDPALAKGLVKREIIEVISPGTVTQASMLDEKKSNYISGIYLDKKGAGIVFIEVSTGECTGTFIEGTDSREKINLELSRFMPSEIIINSYAQNNSSLTDFISKRSDLMLEINDSVFDYSRAEKELSERFRDSGGFSELKSEHLITAAGGLISYLKEAKKSELSYINKFTIYTHSTFMDIGDTAFRNLEISETMLGKDKKGSLLGISDTTVTSIGSRLMRKWITKPLLNPAVILKRQNAVQELFDSALLRGELIYTFKNVSDIERLISRIVFGSANCRDLRSLSDTAGCLPRIRELIINCSSGRLCEIYEKTDDLADIRDLIDSAITNEPPFTVREGNLIRDGYDTEVDRLRYISTHGKELISDIENKERENTGIKNLKVSFNRVFGYYIDITKSNYHLVPENYIRKQTLVNSERYITGELKTIENDILSAEDKLKNLEYNIFTEIRNRIASEVIRIQQTAEAVAELDVLTSFAENAVRYRYIRPEIDLSDRLEITDGRHPVVERMDNISMFVPNNTLLDCGANRIAVITGPNMAGKSTYMRQVALITIMAQSGSFVPASGAHIGIVDKIFTRVGAGDDLSSGRSTFMVEMSEVADILKNSSSQSLILLDEIGRGTSTYDGMSIARAVIEFISDKRKIGAKTLFSTHYHELTSLEDEISGLKNYNISVKKRGDEITFLRKIIPGGADDSFGIEVALLAGLPPAVISRAKEILASLEEGNLPKKRKTCAPSAPQLSFADSESSEIVGKLRALNVETLTPIEALNILYALAKESKEI